MMFEKKLRNEGGGHNPSLIAIAMVSMMIMLSFPFIPAHDDVEAFSGYSGDGTVQDPYHGTILTLGSDVHEEAMNEKYFLVGTTFYPNTFNAFNPNRTYYISEGFGLQWEDRLVGTVTEPGIFTVSYTDDTTADPVVCCTLYFLDAPIVVNGSYTGTGTEDDPFSGSIEIELTKGDWWIIYIEEGTEINIGLTITGTSFRWDSDHDIGNSSSSGHYNFYGTLTEPGDYLMIWEGNNTSNPNYFYSEFVLRIPGVTVPLEFLSDPEDGTIIYVGS